MDNISDLHPLDSKLLADSIKEGMQVCNLRLVCASENYSKNRQLRSSAERGLSLEVKIAGAQRRL